jgi:hypothetical protein
MALQDSDSERRNLVVASIAFIAYFYAGGSFPETTIQLQVINARFSKPEILSLIVWAMYFWFIYRYWVTHRDAFTVAFSAEFNEWRRRPYIRNYVNKYFSQVLHPNSMTHEYYPADMTWRSGRVIITCHYSAIDRNEEGDIRSISSISGIELEEHPPQLIPLKSFNEWMLALRASIACILKKPSFSSYIVPYILVILTFAGALKRCFF